MQDSDDLHTCRSITGTAIECSGAMMRVGARERPAAHVWDGLGDAYMKKLVGWIDNYGASIEGVEYYLIMMPDVHFLLRRPDPAILNDLAYRPAWSMIYALPRTFSMSWRAS
jgi:hypothetical protein